MQYFLECGIMDYDPVLLGWFRGHDLEKFIPLFQNKGFDDLDLILETVTDDLLRKDFPEIQCPGDRAKIVRAIRRTVGPQQDIQRRGEQLPTAEEQSPVSSAVVHKEGILFRKHEWEAVDKKAVNRSWDTVYVVIHNSELSCCYKDQKHAKQDPSTRIHHESAFNLAGAKCEPATDYHKQRHVFRLRLASGAEYLFQAKDKTEMDKWLEKILTAGTSDEVSTSAMPSKS